MCRGGALGVLRAEEFRMGRAQELEHDAGLSEASTTAL
jgi:hypothetical protein